MKQRWIQIVALAGWLVATPVIAQERRGAGVDLTAGRHSVRGGDIDERTGLIVDVLVAGHVPNFTNGTWILAGGGSLIAGGNNDRCRLRPDGGCAPKANLGVLSLLVGEAYAVGRGTVRTLLGPAFNNGAGDRSIGFQARVDLSAPLFTRVGVGAMLRTTLLPSHGGDRLMFWAAGASLTLR